MTPSKMNFVAIVIQKLETCQIGKTSGGGRHRAHWAAERWGDDLLADAQRHRYRGHCLRSHTAKSGTLTLPSPTL